MLMSLYFIQLEKLKEMNEKNMYFPYRYLEIIVQKETWFLASVSIKPQRAALQQGCPQYVSDLFSWRPAPQLPISLKFPPAHGAVPGTGQMFDKELDGTGFLSQCFDSSCALPPSTVPPLGELTCVTNKEGLSNLYP